MNKQRIGILIAAALGALATFMPWVKVPILGTINGTKGDGWITFVLFLIPLLVTLLGDKSKSLKVGMTFGALIPSIIAAAVGIWKISDFKSLMAESQSDDNPFVNVFAQAVSIEFGLYLVIIAGVLIPIIALAIRDKVPQPKLSKGIDKSSLSSTATLFNSLVFFCNFTA